MGTHTNKKNNGRTSVTVIGLGQMGSALAEALLNADHPTTVWNRSPEKTERLVAKGAKRATTVAEAVSASELVIMCLSTYEVVHQVLADWSEARPGHVLVNLTSGTPEQAREMARITSSKGIDYLDGAMMAVPQTVATPDAFFLYSGSNRAFEAHKPVLDVLAASHYFGTDPGTAEIYDFALLGTGYSALTGFLYGAALLDTADVAPSRFMPLATQWLNGMIDFMSELTEEIESGEYDAGVSPVDMNLAAVQNLISVGETQGVDSGVYAPLLTLLQRRSADGHGDDSFSSLFELLRKSVPVT